MTLECIEDMMHLASTETLGNHRTGKSSLARGEAGSLMQHCRY
jgi:hypothetical protein